MFHTSITYFDVATPSGLRCWRSWLSFALFSLIQLFQFSSKLLGRFFFSLSRDNFRAFGFYWSRDFQKIFSAKRPQKKQVRVKPMFDADSNLRRRSAAQNRSNIFSNFHIFNLLPGCLNQHFRLTSSFSVLKSTLLFSASFQTALLFSTSFQIAFFFLSNIFFYSLKLIFSV